METIHTTEGSFGNEFPPIYNHCRVDGLNSTFSLFWKSHPLREHFQNSARKKIHRNSNRRVVFKFRDFRPREIGDVMIYMTKISPGSSLWSSHYCADIVPKICQGQPQTMYSVLQISSKSVHFQGSYIRTREHRHSVLRSEFNIQLKPSFKPNNNYGQF